MKTTRILAAALLACVAMSGQRLRASRRPAAIVERGRDEAVDRRFRRKVTTRGGPDFVPTADRIATFDNDGTLWCEQPMYVQAVFAPTGSRPWRPSIRNGTTRAVQGHPGW